MNTFYGKIKKHNGQLFHVNVKNELRFNNFKEKIPEGAAVEVYMEQLSGNKRSSQLAKVHILIRLLSMSLGEDITHIKLLIKQKAGLCFLHKIDNAEYLVCKSFGDCSFEELSIAIQAAIDVGIDLNIPVL
jgi:hypothetical protein